MIAAGCSQTPGKRAYRRCGVLGRDLSGLPTNQELTRSPQISTGRFYPSCILPILKCEAWERPCTKAGTVTII